MTRSEHAAARRTLHRYRRLILLARLRLPLAEARALVGPDCAYRLYFHARAPLPRPGRRSRRARARRCSQ